MPGTPDPGGGKPLWEIARGSPEDIRRYVASGGNVDAGDDQVGITLLSWAASAGLLENVRTLLDLGAGIDLRSPIGWTPLMHGLNHPDVTRLLIERKADINARDTSGNTVAIHAAGDAQNISSLKVLVAAGADVHACTPDGNWNAVSAAAGSGSIEALCVLFDAGVPLESMTRDCKTPLIRAARSGRSAAALFLIEKGANARHRDKTGSDAAGSAEKNGHHQTAKLIREAFAAVEKKSFAQFRSGTQRSLKPLKRWSLRPS